jgi:hypothetical protein
MDFLGNDYINKSLWIDRKSFNHPFCITLFKLHHNHALLFYFSYILFT